MLGPGSLQRTADPTGKELRPRGHARQSGHDSCQRVAVELTFPLVLDPHGGLSCTITAEVRPTRRSDGVERGRGKVERRIRQIGVIDDVGERGFHTQAYALMEGHGLAQSGRQVDGARTTKAADRLRSEPPNRQNGRAAGLRTRSYTSQLKQRICCLGRQRRSG